MMVEIDYGAMRKERYKSLFDITLREISVDIKELFEKHARDYVRNSLSAHSTDGIGDFLQNHGNIYGMDEEHCNYGIIDLATRDRESHLHVEVSRSKLDISISLKQGMDRDALDELIPCIIKYAARLTKFDEVRFCHVEDEAIKKWCIDNGYEENVEEYSFFGEDKMYNYHYVLHIGNAGQDVRHSIDRMDDRQKLYQAFLLSRGVELKELLEECAGSFLSVKSSLGSPSSDGNLQNGLVGSLAYSSYNAVTDIGIRFYTNSIVIHRFKVSGKIRKYLDGFLDKVVGLAKYFVDIESVVFLDVENHVVRNWCLGNGFREDGAGHGLTLALPDGPVEEQLHGKDVGLLAAFLYDGFFSSAYSLSFYALNHEDEEDLPAPDLMHKLVGNRDPEERGRYLPEDDSSQKLMAYSKYEYWEVEAAIADISPGEVSYDAADLYRDGRTVNNVAKVFHKNGMLLMKLNVDLDVVEILLDSSIRSLDIVDRDDNYLLRASADGNVDGKCRIVFDFRNNRFYNTSDRKMRRWEVKDL